MVGRGGEGIFLLKRQDRVGSENRASDRQKTRARAVTESDEREAGGKERKTGQEV